MVYSTTTIARPTSIGGGNLVRWFLEGGVGLHTGPRPSNIHKVDAGLLECPLLLIGFPDGVDIGSEAEKGETFRRLALDLLRADGDGADERGSGQQGGNDERGGELHEAGLGTEVLATEGDRGKSGNWSDACSALYQVRGGVENVGGFPEAGASLSVTAVIQNVASSLPNAVPPTTNPCRRRRRK